MFKKHLPKDQSEEGKDLAEDQKDQSEEGKDLANDQKTKPKKGEGEGAPPCFV